MVDRLQLQSEVFPAKQSSKAGARFVQRSRVQRSRGRYLASCRRGCVRGSEVGVAGGESGRKQMEAATDGQHMTGFFKTCLFDFVTCLKPFVSRWEKCA